MERRPYMPLWPGFALLFALCLVYPVWAQEEYSDVSQIEEITVTATKTSVSAELSPVTAYSVDREDLDCQPSHYMNNFGEFIRDLPGVSVGQYYPWGPPWVQLRGTGHFLQRTAYLIDGIPVHAFLSPTINPNDIEQVDVVLGPSSALYGPSAAGGAVNIITRSGRAHEGISAQVGYGGNNTFKPSLSIGDRKDNFTYRFSYSGEISDGYKMKPVDGMVKLYNLGKTNYVSGASVEDNDYSYQWVGGKMAWNNHKDTTVTLALNYMDRYLYGGQKNAITNDHGDSVVSSLRVAHTFTDQVKLTATTGYQYQSIPSQANGGASLINGVVVVDDTITETEDWDRKRIPLELQGDFTFLPNNVLTAGVYFAREEETLYDYDSDGTRTYRYELTTDQTAVYLQDQVFFMDDRLSLLGGIRYDKWEYKDIYDSGSSDSTPDDVDKDKITYRGGIKFRVNDTLALHSSAGTAFWPGNPKWLFQNKNTGATWREANTGLEPEETWMVDLGADITIPDWNTLIRITAYHGVIENIMAYTYEPNEPFSTTLVKTRNIGEAEINGVEVYIKQPITDHLAFTGSLTLNNSEITKDETNPDNVGNELRNSPDYFGSLGLRYLNPRLFNWEILFRFSDDRYYTDNNEDLPYFHMESFETFDVKVWRDWALSEKVTLHTQVSVVNLLDEEYATEIVYVNPGRYAECMMGIRYAF
ncbi:MAG: TonB-dependent receptor [Desulfobacterales bacterium]|nr:TonB-dependent receptor [Desulfobacterales bacterium]